MNVALDTLTLLTTGLCAILLLRGYHNVRKRLLLWSGLCFVGLAIGALLRIIDLRFLPATDLYSYRLGMIAVAMALLLYGLIWESQ